MTTEQKENLVTWAQQRDALLLEISNLKTESETLQRRNRESAEARADTEVQMHIIQGRIIELKNSEADLLPLISQEISTLEIKKGKLEAEIPILFKIVKDLNYQKDVAKDDVACELATFESLRGQALNLGKVIEQVTTVSTSNTKKIDTLVLNLGISLEEIIAVNKKNVTETNFVIEKLPAMMLELQKAGLLKTREGLIKIKD